MHTMTDRTTSSHRYLEPDAFTRKVFNPLVAWLTRHGVSLWGSRVLEVVGRRSGERYACSERTVHLRRSRIQRKHRRNRRQRSSRDTPDGARECPKLQSDQSNSADVALARSRPGEFLRLLVDELVAVARSQRRNGAVHFQFHAEPARHVLPAS